MEQKHQGSYLVRESIYVLLVRLIVLELLLEALVLLPRIILNTFFPGLYQQSSIHFIIDSASLLFTLAQIFASVLLFLQWENHYFEIKGTEISEHSGIIHKNRKVFSFVHLESVDVMQGLLGRIFNYGSLHLFIPTLRQETTIMNIPKPHEMANYIKEELPKSGGQIYIKQN